MDNDELLVVMKEMFEKKIEEVKTHTGVLVEHLVNEVKAVAEGHGILLNKIDNVEKRIDTIDRRIDNVEKRIDNVEKRIDTIDRRIDTIDKNIEVVKDYVIGVDLKLNEHEVILKRVK